MTRVRHKNAPTTPNDSLDLGKFVRGVCALAHAHTHSHMRTRTPLSARLVRVHAHACVYVRIHVYTHVRMHGPGPWMHTHGHGGAHTCTNLALSVPSFRIFDMSIGFRFVAKTCRVCVCVCVYVCARAHEQRA